MFDKLQQQFEPQLSTISAKYNQLEAKDQKALLLLAGFLVLFFIYALVWSPIAETRENAERVRDTKRSLVEWMTSKEGEARAASMDRGKSTRSNAVPILTIINRSAQQNRITLKRFEPDGDAKLRIWVEEVPFSNFILWVQGLETKHQIYVSSLSLDNPDQSGRISAKLTLKR
ncbi:MAG: type II secretion system protein M [Gammaproteobacteria bacterium]|nr:type II secretion system protein M [Gammaproteobacteria bacterium]